MTLVCVSKIPSKIATEFSQKFSRLLRRAKRGTRSVKFFTKGSPRVLVGPSTRIFLTGFSQTVPFSRKVQVAKERANTKVTKRKDAKKNMKFSQK
jgi:hypothetical protein